MIFRHEFTTPRNLYEKLVRDYEHLDMVVSGDTFFNFVSTACYLHEWLKNAPQSEVLTRFVSRVSRDSNFKLCKDILAFKVTFTVIIEAPEIPEDTDFEHIRTPESYDLAAYQNDTKKFLIIVGAEQIDVFKFKEEVINLFNLYFKVK